MTTYFFHHKLFFLCLIFGTLDCTGPTSLSSDNQIRAFDEPFRPQFHFTPEKNWMNDPNGMFFLDGKYHLFFQHNPDSNIWGPMHWGHAISEDLVHWQHLPIALEPDSIGTIFSGSAVVDRKNTSGFGSGESPPVVAIYTYRHHGHRPRGFESQALAYSLDKGHTWTKYNGNPVLADTSALGFRDPKVFWHDGTQHWIMVLAAEDRVKIFSSQNLKTWEYESDFGLGAGAHGGVWECPDLFSLPVAGETTQKWVMLVSVGDGSPNGGSGTQYFIGDFDGHRFIPVDTVTRWLDYGKDNYAGVTWSGLPDRRILIGWMSNWQYANQVPTVNWRSAMTVPRELQLQSWGKHYQLISKPVKELQKLQKTVYTIASQKVTNSLTLQTGLDWQPSAMTLTISSTSETADSGDGFSIVWQNEAGEKVELTCDLREEKILLDRKNAGITDFSPNFPVSQQAPLKPTDVVKLHILLDRSSMEIFINDGELVLSSLVFPRSPVSRVSIIPLNQSVEIRSGEVWQLASIWGHAKK